MQHPQTLIDGYKLDHRRQYPKNTTRVLTNWTPRASRIPSETHAVFVGLQYFLLKYLIEEFDQNFFLKDADSVVNHYTRRVNNYLGPNSVGVDHIKALHKLGYLPLRFKALPEGTRCPLRVPAVTVENTNSDFFWLPNYMETLMSSVLWMPSTSASTSLRYKKIFNEFAELTGSPKEFVPWQGHDFSFRGMPGPEAASLSGLGHLVNFTGTDTIPAIDLIEKYYGLNLPSDYLIGGSVAATEHSVMCAGGKESEIDTLVRLMDLYPNGIVSVVSDTWDLWKVLTDYLPKLKDRILSREGKFVVRPDSGDPVKILTGDPDSSDPRIRAGVVELLERTFGSTKTHKGYKVLDPHVGAIYGDSITVDRGEQILLKLQRKNYASCNTVLGIGSYTYQYTTRDQYGWAMKATWAEIDGVGYDLYKDPITDDGVKRSAKGRLAVKRDDSGELYLIEQASPKDEAESELKTVWEDGAFKLLCNIQDIRNEILK